MGYDDLLIVNLVAYVWVELLSPLSEKLKRKYEINDETRTGYNEASIRNHRASVNAQ